MLQTWNFSSAAYIVSTVLDAMDVTKQSDMSGFYRNLYKQTVGSGPDSSRTDEKNTEKSPDIKVEAEVKPDKPTEASSKNNKR